MFEWSSIVQRQCWSARACDQISWQRAFHVRSWKPELEGCLAQLARRTPRVEPVRMMAADCSYPRATIAPRIADGMKRHFVSLDGRSACGWSAQWPAGLSSTAPISFVPTLQQASLLSHSSCHEHLVDLVSTSRCHRNNAISCELARDLFLLRDERWRNLVIGQRAMKSSRGRSASLITLPGG